MQQQLLDPLVEPAYGTPTFQQWDNWRDDLSLTNALKRANLVASTKWEGYAKWVNAGCPRPTTR